MGHVLFMALVVATADASAAESLRDRCLAIIDKSIGEPADTSNDARTQRRAKLFDMFREGEKLRSEIAAWLAQRPISRAASENVHRNHKARLERIGATRGCFLSCSSSLQVGQVRFLHPCDWNALDLRPLTVLQVVNDREMIVKRGGKQLLWVKGFSTAIITDDTHIYLDQIIEITGTKRYATVLGGSNTILLVEPFRFTREDLKAVQKALAPQPKQPSRPIAEPADKATLAANILRLGKRFRAEGNEEAAKKWFRKVIERYPDTEAAKEARVLLGE